MKKRLSRKMRKMLLMVAAMALVLGLAIGGTVAWLADETKEVKNVFTVGNIDIDLAESKNDFEMIPGKEIAKDPKVTVKANSEACWVFVELTESTDPKLTDYITYTVDSGWNALDATKYPGVYYREQDATTTDVSYSVLTGDTVEVKGTVTKTMMDNLQKDQKTPTLSVQAYAIQRLKFDTAEAAWEQILAEQFDSTTGANNTVYSAN